MSSTEDRSFREKVTRWFKIAVAVYVIATLGWFALAINGSTHKLPFVENETLESIQATSTVEFNLEGIEDQGNLEDRIEVMIDRKRAQQQKDEAEQKLNNLKQKQTSLE